MNQPVRGLHGQAVEVIGAQIVRGTYAPGASLYPDQLERELGVSKTVVREALRVLASKGLIDSRQKRGTFVRPRADWNLLDSDLLRWQGLGIPDETFLDNLGEVRSIVEPAGARLAAERRDDADLAALSDALERMAAAGSDADAVVEADLAFHRALLAAAHNELLTRMEVVIEAGLRVRDHIVHGADHWADAVPAHRAVLDAVRAREPEVAARAVQDLLAQAAADLRDLIDDSNPGETG
ncbi:FadR/GntR family transcriptional regulator [Kitasatospora sp. GAS204B]|uniref:FadR/GntR family transcriptional regulator n=1 Tax=unclassified Kitasatospora TaxID=2633591 RepID=UPI002473C113|nr:FadR/GntR family transcriptional regulator [Kitasatospora sp. GAS204B]MDH6118915.1 GntR family galactonate operon transcriptional repressor [Kitasatospora sp. GAS204B]